MPGVDPGEIEPRKCRIGGGKWRRRERSEIEAGDRRRGETVHENKHEKDQLKSEVREWRMRKTKKELKEKGEKRRAKKTRERVNKKIGRQADWPILTR